jgi:hypothetical protein
MTPTPADPFFVGYFKKVPRVIARFALWAGAAMAGALIAQAVILPLATADPGSGRYANDLQGGTLVGMIDPLPYPILRVRATGDAPARAVLLGGQTKIGVQPQLRGADATAVEVGGIFVRRGDFDMLLSGPTGIRPAPPATPAFVPAPPEPLGAWRLTGEICDGKCYAGAMKPGRGLAHRACANLCIQGGLPPVLVMELPLEGHDTILLAGSDGGPVPPELLGLTALPVELEGRLERRDDLLILRVDAAQVVR